MLQKLSPLDIRIPTWNLDDLVERSCPVCNATDANFVCERPDNLKIKYCDRCHTHFVSPSPSKVQLNEFYKGYDEKHRRSSKINRAELAEIYENQNPFENIIIRELFSIMKFKHSHILDIGFGRANLLYNFKKLGAVSYGIELDPEAIETAKFLGIENVFQCNLENFSSETRFNLITMNDLIEHPLSPMDLLQKSTELLQPGGFLLFYTPNGNFAHFDESRVTFRVDLEHMQYFSPDACFFIASQFKLRIVHLETIGFPRIEGIDKPFIDRENRNQPIKKFIKSLPGFSTVIKLRNRLFVEEHDLKSDERCGAYHLLCIMQKPV